MNKVIEHVFNPSKRVAKKVTMAAQFDCARRGSCLALHTVHTIVIAAIEGYKSEWVREDIALLPVTYQYIIDHNGDHAPSPYN